MTVKSYDNVGNVLGMVLTLFGHGLGMIRAWCRYDFYMLWAQCLHVLDTIWACFWRDIGNDFIRFCLFVSVFFCSRQKKLTTVVFGDHVSTLYSTAYKRRAAKYLLDIFVIFLCGEKETLNINMIFEQKSIKPDAINVIFVQKSIKPDAIIVKNSLN